VARINIDIGDTIAVDTGPVIAVKEAVGRRGPPENASAELVEDRMVPQGSLSSNVNMKIIFTILLLNEKEYARIVVVRVDGDELLDRGKAPIAEAIDAQVLAVLRRPMTETLLTFNNSNFYIQYISEVNGVKTDVRWGTISKCGTEGGLVPF
jgi:hypothetical protein